MGRTFFFTAAMVTPSMMYAEFVFFYEFFFLRFLFIYLFFSKLKIIWVAHKWTGSVGNQNQIHFCFRPQCDSRPSPTSTCQGDTGCCLSALRRQHAWPPPTDGGGGDSDGGGGSDRGVTLAAVTVCLRHSWLRENAGVAAPEDHNNRPGSVCPNLA